jgi:hypothetical protein
MHKAVARLMEEFANHARKLHEATGHDAKDVGADD